MFKYSLLIFFVGLWSVQASDDTKFNITRVAIKNVIRKTVQNFDTFLTNLSAAKDKLGDRISSLEEDILAFERTRRGQQFQCAKDLVFRIDRLETDLQESLNSNPGLIVVNATIEEFFEKMQICYDDLDGLRRYFDCEDEACRDEVQALAEAQLKRSTEGLRVKGMMQKISENYPQIDAVIAEYKRKYQDIRHNLFIRCKLQGIF